MTQVYRPDGVGDTIANITGCMITWRVLEGCDVGKSARRGLIVGFHRNEIPSSTQPGDNECPDSQYRAGSNQGGGEMPRAIYHLGGLVQRIVPRRENGVDVVRRP